MIGSWTTGGIGADFETEGTDIATGLPYVVRTDRYADTRLLGTTPAATPRDLHFCTTAGSVGEAQVLAQAHVLRNYWPVTADMHCVGTPFLRVGNLCFVSGTSADTDGYWVVRSVKHIMSAQTYDCVAVLGRDSTGNTQVLRPNMPWTPPPASVRINGEWVSSAA
jgi:hypothetical protein